MKQKAQNTCFTSSGVFCGGTEAAFLFKPLVMTSYSFATRRAFMYSRLRSSCIFLAMIGLIDCGHSNNHDVPVKLTVINRNNQQATHNNTFAKKLLQSIYAFDHDWPSCIVKIDQLLCDGHSSDLHRVPRESTVAPQTQS